MTNPKRPAPWTTIADAKLDRIRRAVYSSKSGWTKNNGDDIPSRFLYDHGNMLVVAKSGKKDLLFEHNGDSLRSNATRCLYEMSPDIIDELMRGYVIARAAGLLGDDRPPLPEVAEIVSQDVTDRIYTAIRLNHRKSGKW